MGTPHAPTPAACVNKNADWLRVQQFLALLKFMAIIQVLNGPNLNLLGHREPRHYGRATLDDIRDNVARIAKMAGHESSFLQSNAEHVLVDAIHEAGASNVAFIIINPAALTHTSVALRDAILGVAIPFIEVHISNIYAREPFRAHSYLSDIATGVITGLGAYGYELAIQAAIWHIDVKHQRVNDGHPQNQEIN